MSREVLSTTSHLIVHVADTDASIDFSGIVKPGERVTISAQKMFFRRGKLRSEASMALDDGTVVCAGTISGLGVER